MVSCKNLNTNIFHDVDIAPEGKTLQESLDYVTHIANII
ncbi:hypothetical protein PH505_cx00060 [Pseudoalteromonas distincta]|nr:hypothetical protein PH505_cx00060 [Pseudoalteromonas distincta]